MQRLITTALFITLCSRVLAFTVDYNRIDFPTTNALNQSSLFVTIRDDNPTHPLFVSSDSPLFVITISRIDPSAIHPSDGYQLKITFKPISPQVDTPYTGKITIINDYTSQIKTIEVRGKSLTWQSSLVLEGTLHSFQTSIFIPSLSQTLSLKGEHLTDNITITAPIGFELSRDLSTFTRSLLIEASEVNEAQLTIHIRLNASFVSSFRGELKAEGSQYTLQTIPLVGNVTKGTLTICNLPTASRHLTYGEPLGNVLLLGGEVHNSLGNVIEGRFRWVHGDNFDQLEIGHHDLPIYFVPDYSYGYQTVNSVLFIRVLPATQHISWEQYFDTPLTVGSQLELTASSSSSLPVRYEINRPDLATIYTSSASSLLQVNTPGRIRLSVFQDGNTHYQEARGITQYIDIIALPEELEQPSFQPKAHWIQSSQSLHITTPRPTTVTVYSSNGTTLYHQRITDPSHITLPRHATKVLLILYISEKGEKNTQKLFINP